VITFERPYTTLVDVKGQVQQYNVPPFHSRRSSAHTLRLFQSPQLDTTLSNIVGNAVDFISDLDAFFKDRRLPVNPLELQKHASLLIYRLFDWYKLGEENLLDERSAVDQSVCLSLMIFLVIAANTNYDVMVQTAAQKLKVSLSKCFFRWSGNPDLLTWTLLMGALATYHPRQPLPDFLFFKQYCGLLLADQGFNEVLGAEDILERMKKCIWLPKLDEKVKTILLGMRHKDDVATNIKECPSDGVMESVGRGLDAGGKEHIVGVLTSGRFFENKGASRRE
jgi:hypothetical protein